MCCTGFLYTVCMFSPYSLWELLLQHKIRLIRESKLTVGVNVFVIISLTLFLYVFTLQGKSWTDWQDVSRLSPCGTRNSIQLPHDPE